MVRFGFSPPRFVRAAILSIGTRCLFRVEKPRDGETTGPLYPVIASDRQYTTARFVLGGHDRGGSASYLRLVPADATVSFSVSKLFQLLGRFRVDIDCGPVGHSVVQAPTLRKPVVE